ncbi:MAG TPA: hypothetical protein VE987_22775 [Polyangiaceae bacterium]|nr:hypothetical protein [Polyangiaceae bacterium]
MPLPSDESLRWIVTRLARLRAAHGDAFADVPLVEPTGAFFPDEFRGDLPSVGCLLRRLISYAPISGEVPVEIGVLDREDEAVGRGGGCGSAGCGSGAAPGATAGRVEELSDGYRVLLAPAVAGHPDLLVATLARSVGTIVRLEAGEPAAGDAESEVAAVTCGFGALLLGGAAVWAKSCGSLRVARATTLSVDEIAAGLARFLLVHGHPESRCRLHLGATQREALDRALDWAASNDAIVEALRDQPALLEGGGFSFEPVRGPLFRWLHRRKADRRPALPRKASAPQLTEGQRRRLDEARALVEEVFGSD